MCSSVSAIDGRGHRFTIGYDRLVLATGSELNRPPIPGLAEHAFSIDQVADAAALEAHLAALPKRPESLARNTVIVGGGGFTGIELACELPQRLQAIFGNGSANRVILVERAAAIGPDLGPSHGRSSKKRSRRLMSYRASIPRSPPLIRLVCGPPLTNVSRRKRWCGPRG